jgi:hypothetical protein
MQPMREPGTVFYSADGRLWVILSYDESGIGTVAPIVPSRPARAGDIPLFGRTGSLRPSAARVAIPRGEPIGAISGIELALALREAESAELR